MKRSLALLLTLLLLVVAVTAMMLLGRRPGVGPGAVEAEARLDSASEQPTVADLSPLTSERAVAEVVGERRGAEKALEEPAPEPPPDEGTGSLWIQFESRETGEPLTGMRLRALVDPMESEQAIVYRGFSRGTELEALVTDELGKAVYHLPAGRDIRLEWWEEGFPTSMAFRKQAPLAANEDRDVLVRVSTEPDLTFVGRVVSSVTGAPLPDSRVFLRQGGRTLDRVGVRGDGFLQLVTESWRRSYLRIECEGHSPALIPVLAGHETVAKSLDIALGPTASIRVLVHDSSLVPLTGVTVVLRFDLAELAALDVIDLGPERFDWAGETDAYGRALLDDLPPGAPLDIEVFGAPFGHQREPEPIVPEAGETKDVVVRILPPGRLLGRLVDRAGSAVRGKEVWLLRAESGTRYFGCSDREASRSAFTDADGRFGFDDVYAGTHLVGPCPSCPRRPPDLPPTDNEQEVATLATPVRVQSTIVNEVELVVDRQLTLTVTVLDGDGKAPPEPEIEVTPRDHPGSVGAGSSPNRPNVFVASPLQQGTFEIVATANQGRLRSRSKVVKAGADDVVLVVRPVRGRIAGRVVSPREGPVYAHVEAWKLASAASASFEEIGGRRVDRVTGAFAYEHLTPGTYLLEATLGPLRATQRVTLDSKDGEVSGVLLGLDAGGQLVVETGQIPRSEDDRVLRQTWHCQVQLAEVTVAHVEFRGIRSHAIDVPAGDLSVRLWRPGFDEYGQTRRVRIRPRQQEDVTFGF